MSSFFFSLSISAEEIKYIICSEKIRASQSDIWILREGDGITNSFAIEENFTSEIHYATTAFRDVVIEKTEEVRNSLLLQSKLKRNYNNKVNNEKFLISESYYDNTTGYLNIFDKQDMTLTSLELRATESMLKHKFPLTAVFIMECEYLD